MPDVSPHGGPGDEGGAVHAERPPSVPRWVKVFGAVVAVLILAFLVLKLAGVDGQHGPGRHSGPGQTSAPRVTDHRPAAGLPNHGP